MKGAFTLIVEKASKNTNVIEKLDQYLKEANFEVHSKEKKENDRLVLTICDQNITSSVAIANIMKNISTTIGVKAKGP
jgi:hypothetical protein